MTPDDRADVLDVETRDLRQHADRLVEIFRVLADDRDGEGVAVLDEDLAVAVVEHSARRAQRDRALIVVFRHLGVLVVLDDLQEPEADRQRRKHRDARDLQHGQPRRNPSSIFLNGHRLMWQSDLAGPKGPALRYKFTQRPERRNLLRSIIPGSDSIIANAMMPTAAFASAWLRIAAHGDGNSFNPSSTYMPMNSAACTIVAITNITNRGNAAVTMNC